MNNFSIRQSDKSTIATKYNDMCGLRSNYYTRGKDYARFTLPYLLPESTPRGDAGNQHGFQGVGAQVTNHLANKLAITLYPPHKSFFKLELSEQAEKALEGFDKTQIDVMLAKITKRAHKVQSNMGFRPAVVECFKHLIVAGNVCLYLPKRGKAQAIPISHYVVDRDASGELLTLIVLQEKSLGSFEPSVQAMIKANTKNRNLKQSDNVKLYTMCVRDPSNYDMFIVTQAAEEVSLGKVNKIKADKLPWIPLRWNTCYGEDYGRGLVEDHSGDFFVIEFLSRAIARGMALMADVKYLVKPGSVTDITALIESPTGEFVSGNIEDIGVLQLEKYADFTPISAVLEEYKKRVGQAFMLNSVNRRDAERVTTYELRLDAAELETSLGGQYSSLSESMQRPIAFILLDRVEDNKLGKDDIQPSVLTGLEALGQVGDLDKLMQFNEAINSTTQWPEGMQQRIKWGQFSTMVSTQVGLEIPWLKSDNEIAEENKAAQESAMVQNAAAEASKAIPDLLTQQGGQ